MKILFILSILAPCFLNADIHDLKRELELRSHECLINLKHTQFMGIEYVRLIEKRETYYEVIDLIEQMEMQEDAQKEEGS